MRPARASGLLVLVLAISSAEAREFRSSDVYPFDYPTVQAVAHVDKLMRERSGGKLSISALGYDDHDSENYTLAQVRNGMLDMARVNLAVLNTLTPATAVPSLPYLFKSKEHARRTLDGPIGDEILASLEAQGLIGLGFYDGGPRHFYTTRKAVRTPADMKGLKVRVQPSDMGAEIIRALGAEPIAVPTDRVYLNLQSGILNASEHNWQSLCGFAPLSRRPLFQHDRAFDGADRADLLQADLGHAVVQRSSDHPRRRKGVRACHAPAMGTITKPPAARPSKQRAARS